MMTEYDRKVKLAVAYLRYTADWENRVTYPGEIGGQTIDSAQWAEAEKLVAQEKD